VLLHLLVIALLQQIGPVAEEAVLPVRLLRPAPAPQRFAPAVAPVPAPKAPEFARTPSAAPSIAADDTPSPSQQGAPVAADRILKPRTLRQPGAKPDAYTGSGADLPTLGDLERDAASRRARALDGYARLWVPDADTTDAESHRRRLAEAIIDRAIEAMGGLERMQRLREREARVSLYSSVDLIWVHGSDQYHAGGRKILVRGRGGMVQGYDGHRAWAYRYGAPVGARSSHLQYEAERWDFLSRFRGEAIVVAYIGAEEVRAGRRVETIQVDDLKFGRTRMARFDAGTGLLVSVTDGAATQEIVAYREVLGVLTPYETWIDATRRRQEVQYNTGLDPAIFTDPGPRTFDAAAMRVLLQVDGSQPRTLAVEQIHQAGTEASAGRASGLRLGDTNLDLLRFYLEQRLAAAGLLKRRGAEWLVRAEGLDYFLVRLGMRFRYTLRIRLEVAPNQIGAAPLLCDTIQKIWFDRPLDDHIVEKLTGRLAEIIGQQLQQAGERAADVRVALIGVDTSAVSQGQPSTLDQALYCMVRRLDAAGKYDASQPSVHVEVELLASRVVPRGPTLSPRIHHGLCLRLRDPSHGRILTISEFEYTYIAAHGGDNADRYSSFLMDRLERELARLPADYDAVVRP
jgi:hypothetical protein